MANIKTPEAGKLQYKFDPNEEYVFYPGPLSRQGSFDTLFPKKSAVIEVKDEQPLYKPTIRKDVAKLKPHYPWFLVTMTVIQVAMLLLSFIFNWINTGRLIQTDPFNFMIGPDPGVFSINKTLILMGARYLPCIKPGSGYDVQGGYFDCPLGIKGTSVLGMCSFKDVCTLGGKSLALSDALPNQWFRFFSPIFLHGGIVHILFNLSFQVQGGFDLEKDMGWWRMALIYVISGVGGFVFGATLSDIRSASVGASGSLYGMIACLLLDLIQNWSLIKKPWVELAKMLANIIVSLLIGTLPYIDNLAHVGGFVFGLLAGILIMPKIYFGKWDRRRKVFLMVLAAPGILVLFYIFTKSFYSDYNSCAFCQYFNCIPGMPWCDQKFSAVRHVNVTTTPSKRLYHEW